MGKGRNKGGRTGIAQKIMGKCPACGIAELERLMVMSVGKRLLWRCKGCKAEATR